MEKGLLSELLSCDINNIISPLHNYKSTFLVSGHVLSIMSCRLSYVADRTLQRCFTRGVSNQAKLPTRFINLIRFSRILGFIKIFKIYRDFN